MEKDNLGDLPGSTRFAPEAAGASSPSVTIPIAERKFFHELDDGEFEAFKQADAKWGDIAKLHPQPEWCEYPGALDGPMGCWSLVGRMVTGVEYCHGCECCAAQGIVTGTAETSEAQAPGAPAARVEPGPKDAPEEGISPRSKTAPAPSDAQETI
jgi:hypothetical protein